MFYGHKKKQLCKFTVFLYDKSDLMQEEKLPAEWRPAVIIKDKNIDDGKEFDWAGHPGIMQS